MGCHHNGRIGARGDGKRGAGRAALRRIEIDRVRAHAHIGVRRIEREQRVLERDGRQRRRAASAPREDERIQGTEGKPVRAERAGEAKAVPLEPAHAAERAPYAELGRGAPRRHDLAERDVCQHELPPSRVFDCEMRVRDARYRERAAQGERRRPFGCDKKARHGHDHEQRETSAGGAQKSAARRSFSCRSLLFRSRA